MGKKGYIGVKKRGRIRMEWIMGSYYNKRVMVVILVLGRKE